MALPRSKYAFLTLPRYSMIALSNAVETLRMANIITGQNVYQWSIVSLDGQPTPASNGLQLSPTPNRNPHNVMQRDRLIHRPQFVKSIVPQRANAQPQIDLCKRWNRDRHERMI